MSLFKTRDLWSFELEQLHHDVHASSQTQPTQRAGNHLATVGRFDEIEGDRDVIIVGNLDGALYLFRVPEEDEPYDASKSDKSSELPKTRQLLAATSLEFPIVDLKCGYFTSALHQSIAVLLFNRIKIFQVKKRQMDLLSSPLLDITKEHVMLVDESLLSHEFDANHSIDLLSNEIALSILVLDCHSSGSLTKSQHSGPESPPGANVNPDGGLIGNKFLQRGKQIVQQLHLPQRDKILIRYANQHLITLIDNKKIIGHFCFKFESDPEVSAAQNDDMSQAKIEQMAKLRQSADHIGFLPMAFQIHLKTSAIIIAFSNYKIYSVAVEKLNQRAKQDIVKRVALNLLTSGSKTNTSTSSIDHDKSSLATTRSPETSKDLLAISINMSEIMEWDREFASQPIQMLAVRGPDQDSVMVDHRQGDMAFGQVLVMSRYQLDLISSTNQHLWSQKFETPLICFAAYTVMSHKSASRPLSQTDVETTTISVRPINDLIILLCTENDCLGENRSNLLVLKNDSAAWSALLSSKPMQVHRINLTNHKGLIATLGALNNELTVSYLGTNIDSHSIVTDDITGSNKVDLQDDCFGELEHLDEDDFFQTPDYLDEKDADECTSIEDSLSDTYLRIRSKLEAKNSWPDVRVLFECEIKPEYNSTKVLHDIIATLEFDDLLAIQFDNNLPYLVTKVNDGLVQLHLGNCWPDRRESISVRATFALRSSTKSSTGSKAMDEMTGTLGKIKTALDCNITPKSLEVKLLLEYSTTNSGVIVQEDSILLPLSMLTGLVHVDYSGGQGQDLGDILSNLGDSYQGTINPGLHNDRKEQNYHFSDMVLRLDCAMIDLIDSLIENDLICRGQSMEYLRTADESRVVTVLEKVNLLAQSLDCRLRYRSPLGFSRQSSEECLAPKMISVALRFINHYGSAVTRLSSSDKLDRNTAFDSDDIVWIHICEMLADSDESLATDLIQMHQEHYDKRDLSDFTYSFDVNQAAPKSTVLISIECKSPIPVVFFQQHLSARFQFQTRQDCPQLTRTSSGIYESVRNLIDKNDLRLIRQYDKLKDELAGQFMKYQLATATYMSLAKKLPDLSDIMTRQSIDLVQLCKNYHKSMMHTIDELEQVQLMSYQLSKIPYSSSINLEKYRNYTGLMNTDMDIISDKKV